MDLISFQEGFESQPCAVFYQGLSYHKHEVAAFFFFNASFEVFQSNVFSIERLLLEPVQCSVRIGLTYAASAVLHSIRKRAMQIFPIFSDRDQENSFLLS